MSYDNILFEVSESVATITLNRPDKLNAYVPAMGADIVDAFTRARDDDGVRAVILTGAGRAFCAGYDLVDYAETPGPNPGVQKMPWDPMKDYDYLSRCTRHFMSLWRSHKPVIGKVHGHAVAGGSDIALCTDLLIMAEDAKIGYPPARVWGCPTTAMWIYRVGAERAKRMLLTGDLIDGKEAQAMGLCIEAVPPAELDDAVERWAERMAGVPKNQLMMQKLMINQAFDNMGLANTQMIATVFDGITRHSPEGMAFKARAEAVGFKQAVQERDSGDHLDELWGIGT